MIQIYFHKKNFDVQKAERWFRERKIPAQMIDLTRAKIGPRELKSVAQQVGLQGVIDHDSTAWKECPARYSAGEDMILAALCQDPRRIKLPIVRNGKLATVGYQPDEWAAWTGPSGQ